MIRAQPAPLPADWSLVVDHACRVAGIGRGSLESAQRDAETVRRRVVVAVLLRRRGWTQHQIAQAIKRTDRQVQRLLAKRG